MELAAALYNDEHKEAEKNNMNSPHHDAVSVRNYTLNWQNMLEELGISQVQIF